MLSSILRRSYLHVVSHAEEQRAQEASQELKRVRGSLSSQAASLRRQEERQRQLEDIIVDLKHDLDDAQASHKAAAEEAAVRKQEVAKSELRVKQAAAAANRARDELADARASSNAAVATGHAELQSTLRQVQQQAHETTCALKEGHAAQIRELQARIDGLHAERDTLQMENAQLCDRVQQLQSRESEQARQAQGNSLHLTSTESLHSAIVGLQQRNSRLQMALARKYADVRASGEQVRTHSSYRC
jgi:golgin subfamily B member 1